MVLILEGNSEIGAHACSYMVHLICLRHLFRSRVVKNPIIFFFRKYLILLQVSDFDKNVRFRKYTSNFGKGDSHNFTFLTVQSQGAPLNVLLGKGALE